MNVSGRRGMFGRRTFLSKCELVHTPRPIRKRFCREYAAWPSKSALEVLSVAGPRCAAVRQVTTVLRRGGFEISILGLSGTRRREKVRKGPF